MIAQGPGKSPDWIEFGLRDALFRNGRRIAAELCNDRTLFPDSEMPLAFDTCDHHRSRNVETRPGEIRLSRNYCNHSNIGTGRCPLDDALGLELEGRPGKQE